MSGLGPTLIRRCLESLGSPSAVINASLGDLVAVEGVEGGLSATAVVKVLAVGGLDIRLGRLL